MFAAPAVVAAQVRAEPFHLRAGGAADTLLMPALATEVVVLVACLGVLFGHAGWAAHDHDPFAADMARQVIDLPATVGQAVSS